MQQGPPALLRLGYFIQAIEQQESAFRDQALLEMNEQAISGRVSEACDDIVPERLPKDIGRSLAAVWRDVARGHLA